jgi:hypothetical protein
MELASNEWKSNNTSDQLLKQQSKNIRSNCAILNDLYPTTDGKISSLMAINFIGKIFLIRKTKKMGKRNDL